MYLGAITRLQSYFKRHRAKANALFAAGAGIGTLFFGYVTSLLIQQFGWRNALRIQVTCVCRMVARKHIFLKRSEYLPKPCSFKPSLDMQASSHYLHANVVIYYSVVWHIISFNYHIIYIYIEWTRQESRLIWCATEGDLNVRSECIGLYSQMSQNLFTVSMILGIS